MRKKLTALVAVLILLSALSGCRTAQPDTTTGAPNVTQSTCQTHEDRDDDGLCDFGGESVLTSVDVYAINDLHGKLVDSATQPGVEELTTYLTNADPMYSFVLSSGDMWQGSSESNLTQGAFMTEWMNYVGVASMTLGNHEFDWGEDAIRANSALAEFPILAINVYNRSTHARADYCDASAVVVRGGVKIGIIGAIGDCYSSISGEHTKDLYFITGSDLVELVKQEALYLKQEQGCDFVIYSVHDGAEKNGTSSVSDSAMKGYYSTELSKDYVDLVFEAHTHKHYVAQDREGVYHLQGGGENAGISHATLQLNTANGNKKIANAEFVDNKIYGREKPDPVVDDLLIKYADEISQANQVLGYNEVYRGGDDLRQMVAELYYEAGLERWGGRYDIVLGGGFISVRNPYSLKIGEVTYSQLQSLFPFDNTLVLCSIPGSSLRDNFFYTDNDNYFISYGSYGAMVKDHIDPNATYYVITDTYSSTYARNRLTEIERYDEGVFARDLLAKAVRAGKLGSKPGTDSYVLTPIAQVLRAGESLPKGGKSDGVFYVSGVVTSVANSNYGNLTIRDSAGDELYVYGVYDLQGNRYGSMANPPRQGDNVLLCGQVQRYVSPGGEETIELLNAKVIS